MICDDWQAIAIEHLDVRLDPNTSAPLVVAVSGGGDSVALLHLVHRWALQRGREFLVVTVDHRLSPNSAQWAKQAAAMAAGLGRRCRVLSWDGPKPASGLPAAARAARHALLATAGREAGARVVLLGHTADDRLEGDWMRRAGVALGQVRVWGPSPVWPEGRGMMLLRPLLHARRADLRSWLTAQGVGWIDDPANADLAFSRARARLESAGTPALPRQGRAPEEGGPIAPAFVEAFGALTLRRDELLGRPDAHAVLSALILCAAGGGRPPRGRLLSGLLARLGEVENFRGSLGGARLHLSEGELWTGRDPGRNGLPVCAAVAGASLVWDGRFEITPEESGHVRAAGGLISRLRREDQARIRSRPAWLRQTLPVLEGASGAVTLPEARSLVGARLRAALGGMAREADLAA